MKDETQHSIFKIAGINGTKQLFRSLEHDSKMARYSQG